MKKRSIRWLALIILIAALGIFSVTVLRDTQPLIESYTADRLAVDYRGVEAGTEAVNMSWKADNLSRDNFMRMEAWVGERWVLIGEHFAPEKSDRIVISHPLSFAHPLYRLTILNKDGEIVDERKLELTYADTQTTPQIVEFNAPARGGAPADALNSGSLYVPVRWHIENRNYNQQPVIEQVAMPSDEAISAPVSDLKVWLQREGTLDMRLVPVDGDTIFLRLRVIDTTSNQTLTENLISLPVVKNADQTLFDPVLPPLDAAILDHVKALYKDGQTQGNKPHSFIKVGDSNIAKDSALCNFGWGNDDLGRFADLQPTVDQFKDSFCAESASAGRSFSSVSLLDPMWATSDSCLPNETPLDCGIRNLYPAYALLYFGVQDVDHALSPDAYRKNLQQILSTLMDHGVIPILSTFATGYTFHNDGSADRLNTIMTQIASDQH
ncbi:MAG: hypothetical protein ABI970_26940, partial [Chloroflexota bacterium]